ncbi:MAG: protoporphyrinogen oxidase [Acidimicrobiia bacterium]
MTDLVVVGGGISGLAAGWEAMRRGADVLVLEADDRPGGKLHTSPFAGVPLDEGADAFLARVPEAVELCQEVGLGDDLVTPTSGSAYVFSEQALRRLPAEQLLGVPTDLDAVAEAGILSAAGLARARDDLAAPDDNPGGDEAVGALVRRRLGDEVLDRLVGPLVGGTWAADCDRLSLQTATPALAAARDADASLVRGAARVRAEAGASAGESPVFLAPRGGMSRLVGTLAEALGDRLRTGTAVSSVVREGSRWRVEPAGITCDGLVLATPAFVTASLVADVAPEASQLLAGLDHASVVLVSLALPRAAIDHPLDGSGFLVPRTAGRVVTACSWVNSKWGHLDIDPDLAVLRVSAGHDGDERAARADDDQLLAATLVDLRELMAVDPGAAPVQVRISRWLRAFPQPRPGHAARVRGIDAALRRGGERLAAAGAWRFGVGIPACIRAARIALDGALPDDVTPARGRPDTARPAIAPDSHPGETPGRPAGSS